MRRNRYLVRIGAATIALLLLATACGGSEGGGDDATAPSKGTDTTAAAGDLDPAATIRIGFAGALQTWDPVTAPTPGIAEILFPPVYDRLVFRNATGEGDEGLSPMLATDWTTAHDGMSTTFVLRKGVKFSDGAPLDAEAVKRNFDRILQFPGSIAAANFGNVASIEVVDSQTVRFDLKSKSYTLPFTMAGSSAWVVSPNASPTAGLTVPIGTGPYRLVPSASSATKQVYERNDDYWGKDEAFGPKLARLEILTLPDDTARFNAFKSGQVDLVVSRISQHAEAERLVQAKAGAELFSTPSKNASFVQLNTTRGPLKDERVRRALSLAVDRDAINQALLSGKGVATDQAFMEGAPGHIEGREPTYDLAKAKQLMAEAGVGDISLRLETYANQPPSTLIAQALQAQWAKIGVKVSIDYLANGSAQPEWIKGNWDLFSTTIPYAGDPEITLRESMIGSRLIGGPSAELQALVEDAASHPLGSDERDEAFQKVNEHLSDKALQISIATFPTEYVGLSRIVGADAMPTSNQSTTFVATVLGVKKDG